MWAYCGLHGSRHKVTAPGPRGGHRVGSVRCGCARGWGAGRVRATQCDRTQEHEGTSASSLGVICSGLSVGPVDDVWRGALRIDGGVRGLLAIRKHPRSYYRWIPKLGVGTVGRISRISVPQPTSDTFHQGSPEGSETRKLCKNLSTARERLHAGSWSGGIASDDSR
jgi:hypothetical protein